MDARDSGDGTQEDKEAQPAEEQEADEDLEDALRELEDARREAERRQEDTERRERTQRGEETAERGSENERTRARLEQDAYTPGFNPVADSNVHAEQEQAQKVREEKERREREQAEKKREEESERERLRLAAVENRTYMIGRASVDMLSDDLIAVRVLREHAVARKRSEEGGKADRETKDNKDSGEEGEHSETREEGEEGDSGEERVAGEYRDFADPELVVVTEQAVCTTEQQARAFAFMQEVDTGRAVVFNRHASSFAGETLRRLVENEHTALRTVETVDRALYPYSFGRPSDKLIAALRVVVLLFAETEEVVGTDTDTGPETGREAGREADTGTSTETGRETGQQEKQETGAPEVRARTRRLLTRESVTVVDRVVEREVQAESTEKEARRERRNASFVDGPSHRREDTPLTPLRHVNRVQIAIDMTGEGDVRRKEEQFRTPETRKEGRNDRGSEGENENENKGEGKDEEEKQEGRTEEEKAKSE